MSIKNAIIYSGSAGTTTGLMVVGHISQVSPSVLYPEILYFDSDNTWDSVSLGLDFGLGIKNGVLYSWGDGASYRTGHGSQADLYEPTQVGSETDWWMVSAGTNHSVGIRKTFNVDHYDYTLWVWGESGQYATGTGSTTDVQTPTQIGTDTDWEWVSAGDLWSCAVKNGMLYTCGTNSSYRSGQNTTTGFTTTWTSYDSSTGWTKCFAGYNFGIGIKGGELWGWGEAGNYQFGNNNTTDLAVPTQVNASTNWVTGSCGYTSSGFINSSSQLYVAGQNFKGECGVGNTTAVQSWTQVGTDTNWEKIYFHRETSPADWNYYSIAIKGGGLYMSGNNAAGEFGVLPSVASNYTTFQQIGAGTNYTGIASSYGLTLAIRKT